MAGTPRGLAGSEASRKQVAQLETRRDLGPCLKMIDAIPCAVAAGFECELYGEASPNDYVCRREHATGFALVDLHLREVGWVSYFEWVTKPPSK